MAVSLVLDTVPPALLRKPIDLTGLADEGGLLRASGGASINGAGLLDIVGVDTPRYVPDFTRTEAGPLGLVNQIRNSRAEVTGDNAPANWTLTTPAGVTRQVLGNTVLEGVPGFLVRFTGTAGSSPIPQSEISPEPPGIIPAASGESVASILHMAVVSGGASLTGLFNWGVSGRTAGGAAIGGNNSLTLSLDLGGAITRCVRTLALPVDATLARAQPRGFLYFTPGPVDVVLFIGAALYYRATPADPGGMILPPPGWIGAWSNDLVPNMIRNPRQEGSNPTAPNLWPSQTGFGITQQIIGRGVEDGIPYADWRLFGTSTAATSWLVNTDSVLPVQGGETWTAIMPARCLGDVPAALSAKLSLRFRNTGGGIITSNEPALPLGGSSLGSSRAVATATGHATAVNVAATLLLSVQAGETIDTVLRIGAPALMRTSVDPVRAPLPPERAPQVSGGLRRLGLLVEEARQNLMTNPRGEGAKVGGTGVGNPPTQWGLNSAAYAGAGLAIEVLAIPENNVVDGIPCLRIRISGTATAALSTSVGVGQQVNIPQGATITGGFYARTVAGSHAGFNTFSNRLRLLDSVPNQVGGVQPNFPATDVLTRRTATASHPSATVAQVLFQTNINAGAAIDVTVDIGGPQIEVGSFPSSLMIPPAGTLATASRAQDSWTMRAELLAGLSLPRGTLLLRWQELADAPGAGNRGIFLLSDGTTANRMMAFVNNLDAFLAKVNADGVLTDLPSVGAVKRGGLWNSYAFTWEPGRAGHALNGQAASLEGIAVPRARSFTDGLRLFSQGTGVSVSPALVSRAVLLPRRAMSDAALVAATS